MISRIKRGDHIFRVEPADGVTGTLIYDFGDLYFRVTDENGEFIDYDVFQRDLTVTIHCDSMTSFYREEGGDKALLDHNPEVLGLKGCRSDGNV